MIVKTSEGRDEIGERALRRSLNARIDSSNEKISVSIACCKRSQEFAWLEFISLVTGQVSHHRRPTTCICMSLSRAVDCRASSSSCYKLLSETKTGHRGDCYM